MFGSHRVDCDVVVLDVFLFGLLFLVLLVSGFSSKRNRMLFGGDRDAVRHDCFRILFSWKVNQTCNVFGVVDDVDWDDCFFD